MTRVVLRPLAFAILFLSLGLGPTVAQQAPTRDQPGHFDFYVLALSWSPSFCKDSEERGRNAGEQCHGRPYAFVVHGLWPQYERGFPRNCQVPAPRLNRAVMTSMLDLMPAPRLVYHEWDSHGTCSGLAAEAYFDLVRKARAAVKVPDSFVAPKATLTVSPDQVELISGWRRIAISTALATSSSGETRTPRQSGNSRRRTGPALRAPARGPIRHSSSSSSGASSTAGEDTGL